MIDWKQAVKVARDVAVETLQNRDLTLEEIERDEYKSRDVWAITLGFSMFEAGVPQIAMLGKRDYKRFLIDTETGEFLAMQLRPVARV